MIFNFANSLKNLAIYGIKAGHIKHNLILALNIKYALNAKSLTLTPLEEPFL
jgi:muramoyltetrapeptide carboxypeptidase LdcA involved in peptidoglycan recycling